MQYTLLGKTGYRVSRLGYGAMRLPTKDNRIDRDKAIPMIARAIEAGVNYIDSAAGYNAGDSERVIGETIRTLPGVRERLVLSTKNPHYDKKNDRPWWENLEGSLQRLGVEFIDVYHFHFLNWKSFQTHVAGKDGQLRWARKAFDQGLIKHIAFSFHDKAENLVLLAKTGEFESVTLQYNLIDRSNEKVIDVVSRMGLGIVVMGPVGGGRLGASSKAMQRLLPEAKSVPEIALRFVLANPSVDVALSGMSEMAHVEENTAVASRTTPLSPDEKRRIRAALTRYKKLADLYCTGCNYCMPCPQGVQIPENFTMLNYQQVYDLPHVAKPRYARLGGQASRCVACGACMGKCPQHIDIIGQLRQTVRTLDEAYGKVVVKFEPVEVLQLPRGRKGKAVVRCRMETHNLSDQEAAPQISLERGMGVSPMGLPAEALAKAGGDGVLPLRPAGVSPANSPFLVTLGKLGPFARARTDLRVELPLEGGGGKIAMKPTIAPPLQMVCATPAVSFALAPRAPSRSSRAAATAPASLISSPVILAAQAVGAGKKAAGILRRYSLAARLAHDAAGLLLQFDASGPFTAAQEKKQSAKASHERNRIVVSLGLASQPGMQRLKGAPASVDMRLFLAPGRFELGGFDATDADRAAVQVRWSGSPARRRITARVPWKVLRAAPPKAPARLGLGFRLVCPHPARGPAVNLAWTDNQPGYVLLMK